ncbi:PQQ-binding-like beta-propeller repeat protein [Aquihabitans sp. G128]|uniref:outer membrane protein assembly factor BamB family protein n=1 Tax=Aquihabitans sp. G128 TaxID=2849779 RepID=UPI001C22AF6B|nr:PQQ-binding-like beta-propeller repeat protein [Aquihabitans sp. G128]QXC61184.1 PQQ-binding-like beta-propeller repeat protein [Aquihabitans sp. G128]
MAESSVCEGCGTVLPLPDAEGVVRCPSCGRVAWTRDPQDPFGPQGPPPTLAPDPAPFATWTPEPVFRTSTTTTTRKGASSGSRVGCLITLVVLLVIGGATYGLIAGISKGTGPFRSLKPNQLYPSSGSSIVVPGEGSSTDLVKMVTDNGDGSQRKLVRVVIGPGGGKETWKSPPLPKDLYTAQLAIDGDDLWVGGGTHLILLSLETGAQRWQATLTDSLTTGCPGCFSVVDGTMVLRTDDAYVTAFAAESNEPRWSRRLQTAAGSVTVAGEDVYVIDDPPTAADLTQVVQLDPASGKVVRTFTPSCGPSDTVPFPIELHGGDPILRVPSSTDLVTYFGFGYGCVTRIDATTGKQRWKVGLEEGNFDQEGAVLNFQHLVFPRSSGSPLRVDLATGKVAELEALPDATAKPRAIVGTTLIAETSSTRGSTKGGLAAWDLTTGKRLWSVRLPGTSEPVSDGPYASSDALFDSTPRTLLVTGGSTVRLVTFTGSDRSIKVQAVDVATGDLGAPKVGTLRSRYDTGGTPSISIESVSPDRLVIGVDSIVEVLDLTDASDASWPPKN